MTRRVAFTVAGSILVVAIASGPAPEARTMQLANPASVYCLQLGGKRLMVQTRAGVRTDCLLPNGKRIDEWKLYRRDHRHRR